VLCFCHSRQSRHCANLAWARAARGQRPHKQRALTLQTRPGRRAGCATTARPGGGRGREWEESRIRRLQWRWAHAPRVLHGGEEERGAACALRDAACPLSTRGGTRLVRLVRGRGGGRLELLLDLLGVHGLEGVREALARDAELEGLEVRGAPAVDLVEGVPA